MITVKETECSKDAWDFICYQRGRIQELEDEILRLSKRLCKHEGHLPITDSTGRTTCELSNEIGDDIGTVTVVEVLHEERS